MPHRVADEQSYEVFLRVATEGELYHVGAVTASDHVTAWSLAREAYGRRDDLVSLWVIDRAHVMASTQDDLFVLAAKRRMPHRQPAFVLDRRTRRDRPPPEESGEAQQDLSALETPWLAIADDLFAHAHLVSAWIGDVIEIEVSLALGSVAQEDLAHARALAKLCGVTDKGIDVRFFDRAPDAWQLSGMWLVAEPTWPTVVARGLITSVAVQALADAYLDNGLPVRAWREVLSAVRDEQALHVEHWGRAAAGLIGSGPTNPEFRLCFVSVISAAGDLFGLPNRVLESSRVRQANNRITVMLADHGIPSDWLTGWPDQPQPRSLMAAAYRALQTEFRELGHVRSQYPRGAII